MWSGFLFGPGLEPCEAEAGRFKVFGAALGVGFFIALVTLSLLTLFLGEAFAFPFPCGFAFALGNVSAFAPLEVVEGVALVPAATASSSESASTQSNAMIKNGSARQGETRSP